MGSTVEPPTTHVIRFLRDWGPAVAALGLAISVVDGAYSGKPVYRVAFCTLATAALALASYRFLRRARTPESWPRPVRLLLPFVPLAVLLSTMLAVPAPRYFCCPFIPTPPSPTEALPPTDTTSPTPPAATPTPATPPPHPVTDTPEPSAPPPEPSSTPIGGGAAQVVFEASYQGNLEIFSFDFLVPFATPENLTSNAFNDYDPCFSPSGDKIAFVSERDGNAEIYTMAPDGANPTNITKQPASDIEPVWSSDGQYLAFSSYRQDSNRNLFLLRLSDGSVQQLTADPACDKNPTWSPDSARIVFASNRFDPSPLNCYSGDFDLFSFDLATGKTTQLTRRTIPEIQPSFSPDGKTLAFVSTLFDSYDIFTVDSEGFNLNRLTVSSSPDKSPTWSTDGTLLIFVSDRSGARSIYRMAPDGASQSLLVAFPNADNPSWRP